MLRINLICKLKSSQVFSELFPVYAQYFLNFPSYAVVFLNVLVFNVFFSYGEKEKNEAGEKISAGPLSTLAVTLAEGKGLQQWGRCNNSALQALLLV